ncbi:MAG TPA: DciA family protein, partial [Gemmatimonas sp.]|nr:DciA family protein [Gemmatimonas sp.]
DQARPLRNHARLRDAACEAGLVGVQIAAVTEPTHLQQDGTLVVMVTTSAWMQELSLLEPELLRSLNRDASRPPVLKVRWMLRR